MLLASAPSALELPAASLNLLLATLMVAVPELPEAGVKVAVYTSGLLGLTVRALKVPPVTAMSPALPLQVKSVLTSLSVKVMVSVPLTVPLPARVIAIVGAVVSVL